MTKKPPKGKSLAEVNPELAKEWHSTLNGDLTPFDITIGSDKKVWWKCDKGDDHQWEASVDNRSRGKGCPICIGRKVVISNCLATVNPKLSKEWHPTKNGNLTPFDVVHGTPKKVWWKCNVENDHEWEASISHRSNGRGCPICSGKKVVKSNSLATINPELAKQWHPTKNGKLSPDDYTIGSGKKVWWKCERGDEHEWEASVDKRAKGRGCPICSGNKLVESNSLATLFPHLVKEWHPTKNGDLTPINVYHGTEKKVWWKCDKGVDHEWESLISNRTRLNVGCPICDGKKVVKSNSLATKKPELVREWHYIRNGKLTPDDLTIKSGKKVWWKCEKGDDHEWKTRVSHRVNGFGCPFCTLTPQSRQELTITFELQQFFDINPKGFKSRVNGKVISIDIYIQELNLGIEFDGSYWHKGKRELDKLKTEKLEFDGFKIMRVREEPLKPITDIDVVSKNPFNAKAVTNEILTHIIQVYSLDTKRVQKIEKYLLKENIQNEKGLDAYIDMILTEKAERKNGNNGNSQSKGN